MWALSNAKVFPLTGIEFCSPQGKPNPGHPFKPAFPNSKPRSRQVEPMVRAGHLMSVSSCRGIAFIHHWRGAGAGGRNSNQICKKAQRPRPVWKPALIRGFIMDVIPVGFTGVCRNVSRHSPLPARRPNGQPPAAVHFRKRSASGLPPAEFEKTFRRRQKPVNAGLKEFRPPLIAQLPGLANLRTLLKPAKP